MSLSDYEFLDDFSFRARWWLPDKPGDRIPGTLSFADGRIQLELDGAFSVPELEFSNLLSSSAIFKAAAIHGEMTDGDSCTVLRAVAFGVGQGSLRLRGNALVVGAHWQQEDSPRIQKVILRFAHLDEWAYQQLFQQGSGVSKESFTFVLPTEPKTLLHIEDLLLAKNLILAANIQAKMERTTTSLINRNQFLVEFKEPANLLTVKILARDIGNLLSLLVGEAVQPLKIRLTLSPDSHCAHPYVDYFLGLKNRTIANKSMFEMPLPFAALGESGTKTLFKNWFLHEENLRPIYSLLLSTVYEPDQYVQSTFLSLVQALETFHRRLYEGIYVPKAEYAETRQSLIAAIPPQTAPAIVEKLTGMLNWGNEFSLRDRLKESLGSLSQECWAKLSNKREQGNFIRAVVDIRNYLTHYKETKKPEIIETLPEMYNLNQQLRAILTVLLFKHLGMEENKVAKALASHLQLAH
ncbi:MAG TPA: HEPN domain-containing protein [Candidatus Acidoferrales bacterium]